jgi:hypothetical protein
MYLQFHIFSLQYSIERIYSAIGDISRIQCASYSKRCAKYSAYPSEYAVWSVVPAIYSVISALHIQASIFKWTYLRWYWRYVGNSLRLALQSLCQIPVYVIWNVVPNIYNVLTAPHNQASIFIWTYLRCYWTYVDNSASIILQTWSNYSAHPPVYAIWTVVPELYNVLTIPHIQAPIFNWTYLRCHWTYIENSMRLIQQALCQIQRISFRLRYVKCGPGHIQCNFRSTHSGFNIQMNVSTLILEICRQFIASCSTIFVPNAILRYLNRGT